MVEAASSFAALLDEVRAPQHSQMLGDGRARDGEGFGNAPCRLAAVAQEVKHGAARGISKRTEGGPTGICKQTVTHNM